MATVKEFNHILNRSYNISEMYTQWSKYRSLITEFIKDVDLVGKSLLIVGSGHLNDINIKELMTYTSNITFVDVDIQSTVLALHKRNLEPEMFNLIELDLTSFDKFANQFDNAVKQGNLVEFRELIEKGAMDYNLGMYDSLIILPIYTQILFQQLVNRAESILGFKPDGLHNDIMSIIAVFIDKINATLYTSIHVNGQVIILSDVFEYDVSDPMLKVLEASIDDHNQKEINAFYESYLQAYGYSLGAYGLYNMAEKVTIESEKFFVWNFDDRRRLIVKGILSKK